MRLSIIDYLRGYSISTIVLFHLLQNCQMSNILEKLINFGGAGVHVFILCSGFGLCLSQINTRLSFNKFIKKRFFKIYVPYIIIILISFLIPFLDSNIKGECRVIALLSHIFLFKMFNESLVNSFGYQFWFISLIIQFYSVFILLFKIGEKMKSSRFFLLSILISIGWSTFIAFIGKADERVWNSFCLQYLWEFVLGIILARKYTEGKFDFKIPKIKYMIVIAIISLFVFGIMGLKGGVFKLYNDIPSLVAYLSLSLIIYSFSIKYINRFFIFTNRFSYEWYLVHILVFACILHYSIGYIPIFISLMIAIIISYFVAILYHQILKKTLYLYLK